MLIDPYLKYFWVYAVLFELLNAGLYDIYMSNGGARGVMVIVVGNGHGDTGSNPGRD